MRTCPTYGGLVSRFLPLTALLTCPLWLPRGAHVVEGRPVVAVKVSSHLRYGVLSRRTGMSNG